MHLPWKARRSNNVLCHNGQQRRNFEQDNSHRNNYEYPDS